MEQPIYRVKNLICKSNQETLLNIKKFEFHRGACYLINGNMGSGKTLFLDIMSKNNKNYNAVLEYEGDAIKSISYNKYYKEVAYVKQLSKRPFFKTVSQYIESHVRHYNQPGKVSKLVNNIITIMDIKYLKERKVRKLSPGQFRWVDLAAKIASFPKVLFIDELEQHLSISKIKRLNKILYRKCSYDGMTIIATSQNKDFFNSLTSVSINLNHGRITSVRSLTKGKKKHS